MVSPETAISGPQDPISSPRLSFSSEFLDDDKNFICLKPNPNPHNHSDTHPNTARYQEFEFFYNKPAGQSMITADELFSDGKLLPFWQIHCTEKIKNMSIKTEHPIEAETGEDLKVKLEKRLNCLFDEDPSPRPPKCTVLWKELLRLKKHRASSLSPSSSSSSSSSSASSSGEMGHREEGVKREKRMKKGLERTRPGSIRIRPMVNVPICSQGKGSVSALPPLFPIRKGRIMEN